MSSDNLLPPPTTVFVVVLQFTWNANVRLKQDYQFAVQNEAILIWGNSGCGKSHIISTTAKVLSLPLATTSAADITAEGYVGLSVSDCVRNLIRVSEMTALNRSRLASPMKSIKGVPFQRR